AGRLLAGRAADHVDGAHHAAGAPGRRPGGGFRETGFWLVPAARGRGIGASAVALLVGWAFSELDMLRVEMTTTPENAAVPALARRLGFTHEGVLRRRNIERGERVDIVWFGLLREEWRER